jgi:hypothetical protein
MGGKWEEVGHRRHSGLRDAHEIAGRVSDGAVAHPPRLGRRFLEDLGARRLDLLKGGVKVVGPEDCGLERSLRHQCQESVALDLRATTVGLGQDYVEVLARGTNSDPAEAFGRDIGAHFEAERIAVEAQRRVGIVDRDEHGGNGERHGPII